ncbi:ATP-binding protein [Paludisphaera sp.]|uniref:sensor histidine kinase n=1 Tax=Paludisphaera sp. TaxID=2017432 RepID=UPI00301CDBCD
MTSDQALLLLSSKSPHERLKAARFLGKQANVSDLPVLRQARRVETVSYVKTSLDATISRLSNLPVDQANADVEEFEVPEEVRKQIWSEAVEWVTGLILHEIASPMGLVKRSASREIPNYESSKTKHQLESVVRIFEAVEQLKSATAVPKPEQFDLAELLNDIIATESVSHTVSISLQGQRPMLITSDRTLVRLAICNGLRNALEAVKHLGPDEPHPIIISWGQTDVDIWVSIMDKGHGIIGPMESAFEMGKSTKQGHSGFGLTIARQAIETLSGSVTLQPVTEGGARYEARWER